MANRQRAPEVPSTTALFDVFVLDQAVSELLGVAMADSPLSPADYAVYSHLELHPGTTVSGLADATAAPLTTASHWVRRLVQRGHGERWANADDRRAVSVALTPEGIEALVQARVCFGRAQRAFLAQLGGSEDDLRASLQRAAAAARGARQTLADGEPGP